MEDKHMCNKECIETLNIEGTEKCIHHSDGGITIEKIIKGSKIKGLKGGKN